ncbi:hypothetical protein FXO37_33226 [Capsicum annuum]|nr:hypothetical protein FXO37_33226 [Capsicum annuum]
MKQKYMKKFKAFMDEPNDTFIDGLKVYLEGVAIITSSEDGEDGYDDWIWVKMLFQGMSLMVRGQAKESRKGEVEEEEEKKKYKKKEKDEGNISSVQSQHSSVRIVCDDVGIKEVPLEVVALEQASINVDEVMIPEDTVVVEKENPHKGDE